MREAAGALGMGPGSPGSNDPKAIAALYRRVRNNPTLRKVCELAGQVTGNGAGWVSAPGVGDTRS